MYKLNYKTENVNVKTTKNDLDYIVNVLTRWNAETSKYELSSARVDVKSIENSSANVGSTHVPSPESNLIAYYQSGVSDFNVQFVKTTDSASRKVIFNNVSDILEEVINYVINDGILEL